MWVVEEASHLQKREPDVLEQLVELQEGCNPPERSLEEEHLVLVVVGHQVKELGYSHSPLRSLVQQEEAQVRARWHGEES